MFLLRDSRISRSVTETPGQPREGSTVSEKTDDCTESVSGDCLRFIITLRLVHCLTVPSTKLGLRFESKEYSLIQ